jgi:tubulin---tyrosine ligase
MANEDGDAMDLSPHLTNTCLQQDHGEANVRLLEELVGCRICNDGVNNAVSLTEEDVKDITTQITVILAQSFKAALQNPVHFQVSIPSGALTHYLTIPRSFPMHLSYSVSTSW